MIAIMELQAGGGRSEPWSMDVDVGGCRFAVGERGWRMDGSVIFCEVFVGECGVCGEMWGFVGKCGELWGNVGFVARPQR
jgi:hypothetical protein